MAFGFPTQLPQPPACTMPDSRQSEIFELDEDSHNSDGEVTGATSASGEEDAHVAGPSDRNSIDPFRRAMPLIQGEEDVCSICLDAFTDEDPGNATVCG